MPVVKNIFIFGDSITYGEWDELGGWANRLRRHFDSAVLPRPDEYLITYNLGIPSDTSEGLCKRLEFETQARLCPNPAVKTFQFIIAIGANDARWLIEQQRRAIDIEQFGLNLELITNTARKFSPDIIFVGLLPCDEDQVSISAKRHQWVESFDNQALTDYNRVIKQHCKAQGLSFVDVHAEFCKTDYRLLFSDGLHPNSQGHALIANAVLSACNAS